VHASKSQMEKRRRGRKGGCWDWEGAGGWAEQCGLPIARGKNVLRGGGRRGGTEQKSGPEREGDGFGQGDDPAEKRGPLGKRHESRVLKFKVNEAGSLWGCSNVLADLAGETRV